MANSAQTGLGQYANLPDYMYWKLDASGHLEILNPNLRIVAPPDESWTRVNFLRDLWDGTKNTYREWVTRDWANYYNGPKPGVARYIFPIPEEAVAASKGKITNDGYMFGN